MDYHTTNTPMMFTKKEKSSTRKSAGRKGHFLILFLLFFIGTVHAQSAGTISGNFDQLCVGSSSDYWSNGWGGGTWSSSNTAVLEVVPVGSNARGKGISAGTADVIYTLVVNSATYTARKTITVSGALGKISEISGVQPQCSNSSAQVYSVIPVTNATAYHWKVPAGWTIISGNNTSSITVNVGNAGGNIEVSASNQCATSEVKYKYINVNPTLTSIPQSTSASNIQCKYAQLNWKTVANADGYYLDISRDSSFTQPVAGYLNFYVPGNNPSYGADNLPAGTLYYRVRATNSCGTSAYSNVVTFQTNAPLGGSVSSPQHICYGTQPNDLILSGQSAASDIKIMRWERASDLNFTLNRSDIAETSAVLPGTKIGNLTTDTYFRAVVQNQFGSWCETYSVPVLITVGVQPSVSISVSPSPVICAGSTESLTFTANPEVEGLVYKYQWKLNGADINGATSSTFKTSTLKENDEIKVEVTSNTALCSSPLPAVSNGIKIITQTAVYNGQWSQPPAPNLSAEIRSAFSSNSYGGGLNVCSLIVTNNATATVNEGSPITVKNKIKVDEGSALIVESDANLIQVNDSAEKNEGNITVLRQIKIGGARNQYNYLGTPVNFMTGESFKTIYSGIAFALYHNEANNIFYNSSGANVPGRGLAVKEPTIAGVPEEINFVTAKFKGVPQNGVINFPLANSNTATNTTLGYNLLGNPYPSNIDLMKLYELNGGNLTSRNASENISSTFYLWDNKVNNDIAESQQGSSYNGQAYALFNVFAGKRGTGTSAAGYLNGNVIGNKIPSAILKVGQGFMVKAKNKNYVFTFNNGVRTSSDTEADFLGKNEDASEDDRFWLKLISPANLTSSLAVVYFDGGSNGVGPEDSESKGASDEIFSLVNNQKMAINGRTIFSNSDVIYLGTHHFTSGNYTITVDKKEGIFNSGQSIYLKDRENGIITKISDGSYTFNSAAGESTGRFEIIYKPETILTTDSTSKDEVVVYRDSEDFVIKAQSNKITEVELYDAVGRLIFKNQPNTTIVAIPAHYLNRGVYLLKIKQEDHVTTKKIIK